MIIDTKKLLAAIEAYEAEELPNWRTCPMSQLDAAEKRGVERRAVIQAAEVLAKRFLPKEERKG